MHFFSDDYSLLFLLVKRRQGKARQGKETLAILLLDCLAKISVVVQKIYYFSHSYDLLHCGKKHSSLLVQQAGVIQDGSEKKPKATKTTNFDEVHGTSSQWVALLAICCHLLPLLAIPCHGIFFHCHPLPAIANVLFRLELYIYFNAVDRHKDHLEQFREQAHQKCCRQLQAIAGKAWQWKETHGKGWQARQPISMTFLARQAGNEKKPIATHGNLCHEWQARASKKQGNQFWRIRYKSTCTYLRISQLSRPYHFRMFGNRMFALLHTSTDFTLPPWQKMITYYSMERNQKHSHS